MTVNNGMKEHWESIYRKKGLKEVSWYQERPKASWELMEFIGIRKDAAIIDIGGGDSLFVDFLLSEGFSNITVLDISGEAISRAKKRLGAKAGTVRWIVSDIMDFAPTERYDLWHDRAVLHFLSERRKLDRYVKTARQAMNINGKLIVGTFSESGPERCSGLTVHRYSETGMQAQFKRYFNKIKCVFEDHVTPFKTIQNFIFCGFQLA
ncbi:MAG: class I SAM-dependent methyltransferase [Thermodesulfobacteriota bacterium]